MQLIDARFMGGTFSLQEKSSFSLAPHQAQQADIIPSFWVMLFHYFCEGSAIGIASSVKCVYKV